MASAFDSLSVDQTRPTQAYRTDESDIAGVMPAAVLLPKNADELKRIIEVARASHTPIFPRGLGSGRTGAATCTGGAVVSFEKMASILEIDCVNNCAWVEPFVAHADLQRELAARGKFFGPDPNSSEFSTLGGNVATNASGPKSYRYGSTRDWTLALEVVTGGADLLRVGFPTRKWTVGYDTLHLMVGSEGTLSLTSKICVRIQAKPECTVTLLLGLAREIDVPNAVANLHQYNAASIEVLDQRTLAILRKHSKSDLPGGGALLAVDFEGSCVDVEAALERAGNQWAGQGVDTRLLSNVHERESFWSVRRQMSRLLRTLAKHKVSEDIVVPVSRLADLWQQIARIGEEHKLLMPAYGHAGDGNLHVNVLWNHASDKPRVEAALAALFHQTIALGGTLSGEHGIGLAKAAFLPQALSEEHRILQREIKRVFDPDSILNPGKIFAVGHRAC